MKQDQLIVEVMDHRLQVNLDEEIHPAQNEFMNLSQGFDSKPNISEEEEDQEPEQISYKIDKLLPKQNQRERLIEQNIKLKTQIYELAKQLDEILAKDKSRKKSYGIGLNLVEEEEEIIREKKLEVKKQQIEIMEMKNKIFVGKRQLESVYNNNVILSKEDEIKNLKSELRTLDDEKEGHLNIQKVQVKALKIVRNEEEYGEKLNLIRNQYNRLKKQTKLMIEQIAQAERYLKKTHEDYIQKLEKIKQLEKNLALNKEKGKHKKPSQANITPEMISSLEAEIKQLQNDRKEGEKNWQQKIRSVDIELLLKRNEQEKKLLILREKEKELKLNELRIRELRKVVKQNAESQAESKVGQDIDMTQFRHKRNIRYIDK